MASFRGILEVEGDPESSLVADVDVARGRITLKAGSLEIGNWDLNDVTIEETGGVFRIAADDGAVLLRLNDAKRFAGTVGVTLSSRFDAGLTPPVVPTPPTRAPKDAPRIVDEPLEPIPPPPPQPIITPPRPAAGASDPLGPDKTPLARHLSWSLALTSLVFFAGAVIDWGPVRLTNSNFPLGRLLIVLAGFGTFAAAYLGLALEKRRDVALVAMLSGIIAVMVIVMFARRAHIGWGFIVTILGAVGVISISVLALSHLGAPRRAPGPAADD